MGKILATSIKYSGGTGWGMENNPENTGKQNPKMWKTNGDVDKPVGKTSFQHSSGIHKVEECKLNSCTDGCPSYSIKERHRHHWDTTPHGCIRGLAAGEKVYCPYHGMPLSDRLKKKDQWR